MGCNVLQGRNPEDLIDIVRCHSRRIHLLFIEENVNNRSLATLLQQYRPTMRVFFVGEEYALPDVIALEILSEKVRRFFEMLHDSADEKQDSTETMKSERLSDPSDAQVSAEREAESLRQKRRSPIKDDAA
jgi:hypothetical protein